MCKLYRIAVCDDERIWLSKVTTIIEQYFLSSLNQVNINVFENALSFLDTNFDYDVLFLDIEMPRMNGIELKNRIAKGNLKVIFVTSYEEYIKDAFGKNVIAFVSKDELSRIPVLLEQIEKLEQR